MADKIITNEARLRILSVTTTWEAVENMNLENRLKAACKTAWTPGSGLAAIQIGIPLKFAVHKWGVLINPRIINVVSEKKTKTEGCLSILNTWVKVRRPYRIKYENDGKIYTAMGKKARVIMHEIDHMNGILITD